MLCDSIGYSTMKQFVPLAVLGIGLVCCILDYKIFFQSEGQMGCVLRIVELAGSVAHAARA